MTDFAYALRKLGKCLYIYIGDAGDRGFGIYAAKPFPEGSVVVADEDGDYYERAITEAEAVRRGIDLSETCFQIGHDRYLLPNGNIDDLVNHSCDPNTGLRLTPEGYRMIALRDIAPGDEITYDYSTYISNPREILACTCGSAQCRGVVGRFADLPPERRRRYLDLGVVGSFAAEPQPTDAAIAPQPVVDA
ncbi:SET domain-containing protein [Marinivivus vitaminiproducens]|uniref:SET domain-containing protein n=1 Tax=Marinivivus vitaminiproducens TaxID=3035935 RepID=UPI00279B191C|nr:SET domain-containing protein-lysine N-methyltransferase [Geminicoccaceae bacterium SCSIO 64248]